MALSRVESWPASCATGRSAVLRGGKRRWLSLSSIRYLPIVSGATQAAWLLEGLDPSTLGRLDAPASAGVDPCGQQDEHAGCRA